MKVLVVYRNYGKGERALWGVFHDTPQAREFFGQTDCFRVAVQEVLTLKYVD